MGYENKGVTDEHGISYWQLLVGPEHREEESNAHSSQFGSDISSFTKPSLFPIGTTRRRRRRTGEAHSVGAD